MDESRNEKQGEIVVRRATLADVEAMHALINDFASKGLMLAKSRSNLYQNIRDFFVAEADAALVQAASAIGEGGQRRTERGVRRTERGVVVGCGALHVLWGDLGEIRSLAVAERFQKDGVGRRIAEALLREAGLLRLPRVFALTYIKTFFERLGFVEVDKSELPQKVWGECYDCPKFPNCDEVAVVKDAPFLEEEGIGD